MKLSNTSYTKLLNICKTKLKDKILLVNEMPVVNIEHNRDYIGSLNIHLVNHCDLNCAGCDHFSPLSSEWYENINNFNMLINRMSELFSNKIKQISLLGGEPLLHPDIIEFCRVVRIYFPNCELLIKTNGLILSNKEDSFYYNISKYNPTILISEYPVNIDIDNIKNMCNKHNVRLTLRNRSEFTHLNLTENNNLNKNKYYDCTYSGVVGNKCYYYPCTQLNTNGDFYFCTIPANICFFNNYFNTNFEVVENDDYVNIYKIEDANIILKKLEQPMNFCGYCYNNINETNYNWKISNNNKFEWLKND